MLEQVGININVSKDVIQNILKELFYECSVHFFSEKQDIEPNHSISFDLVQNPSEFCITLEVYVTPDQNNEEREQYLAKVLSDKLNCKTITSYQVEKNNYSPYESIVFENGHAYLANDKNTLWADGEGGKVQILKKIGFDNYRFDGKANLNL